MWEVVGHMFEDRCLVSCGMLHAEIDHLVKAGLMDPIRVRYTPPGLHALPDRLEQRLLSRLAQSRQICPDDKIIVVHGKKCHVSMTDPLKRVDSILEAAGQGIMRVQGDNCHDMLGSFEDRQRISGGRQDHILWFTPG